MTYKILSRHAISVVEWVQLIRREYLESPGLHLTPRQVERRWGLDSVTSGAILGAFADAGFLRRTRTGGYVQSGTRQTIAATPVGAGRRV